MTVRLENCAAGPDLHGGHTPCVQQQEPIAVSAAQDTRIVRQCGDDVVDHFVFAAGIAVLKGDIHAVAADETHTKHEVFHACAH